MSKFRTFILALFLISGSAPNIYGQADSAYPLFLNSPRKLEQWVEKMKVHEWKNSHIKRHFLVPIRQIMAELFNYRFTSDTDLSWRSFHDFLTVKLMRLAAEGYEIYPYSQELRELFMELSSISLEISSEANSEFLKNYQNCKERSKDNGFNCIVRVDRAKLRTSNLVLNKINVPLKMPIAFMPARNNYSISGWELGIGDKDKFDNSEYSTTFFFEYLEINDENECTPDVPECSNPDGHSTEVLNNWVMSGRVFALKTIDSYDYRDGKKFRPYLSYGPGVFFMHEARRFGPIEERDKYRFGFSINGGGGINFSVNRHWLISTGGDFQFNLFAPIQVRYKFGVSRLY